MWQIAQGRQGKGIGARRNALCAAIIAGLLAGCTLAAGGGGETAAPGSGGLAAEAITVTPLDAPEKAQAAVATPAPAAAEAKPDDKPEGATAAEPAPTLEEPPPPSRSPEEIACTRKGGDWVATGQSGAHACVRPTRDSGKRCTRESQCEGYCLARSGTCAPVTPLFGCNDILQDNGVMVTLCID